MAWPLRLRATSFVVIVGVVMLESAVAAAPIGIALWYFTGVEAIRLFSYFAFLAFLLSVTIAIHGDLGRQGLSKWWRARS